MTDPLGGEPEPEPPLGGEPLPLPPLGGEPLPLPPLGLEPVAVAMGWLIGVPMLALQVHGSVIVTGTGVLSQTVHCLVVTVKSGGM